MLTDGDSRMTGTWTHPEPEILSTQAEAPSSRRTGAPLAQPHTLLTHSDLGIEAADRCVPLVTDRPGLGLTEEHTTGPR